MALPRLSVLAPQSAKGMKALELGWCSFGESDDLPGLLDVSTSPPPSDLVGVRLKGLRALTAPWNVALCSS